jgi:hypothetical protein
MKCERNERHVACDAHAAYYDPDTSVYIVTPDFLHMYIISFAALSRKKLKTIRKRSNG